MGRPGRDLLSYPSGAHMRLSGILHLYRVRLPPRVVQEALAAIGIAVGVALLFASQVASTSLNGSVHELTASLVGQSRLQLQARGPEGFSERLLPQIRRLPGVISAAPVLDLPANVIGPRGERSVELIGAEPSFVHLGGAVLQHFSAAALSRQHVVALPEPIASQLGVGNLQPVTVDIGASSRRVLLGLTLRSGEIGPLADSPVLLAPLAFAQQLAGTPGVISRVFVRSPADRQQEVQAELARLAAAHRLNLEPADFDSTLLANAATPTNQSTGLFAAISALVGFLFAFNAILFTMPGRRRLIADLRLDGYSPASVVQVLLLDALVLTFVGCLLGLALGDLLSARLSQTSPGFLAFAFPIGSQRIVTWQAVAVSVLAGFLAACVGVLTPTRDIFSHRPLAAVERKRRALLPPSLLLLAGACCLLATTLVLLFAPDHAIVGVVTLTAALLLLLPSCIRLVLALVDRLTVDLPVAAPFLAVAELRSQASWSRTVAIASTAAIAVFGSVAIQGARMDLQRGLDTSAADVTSAAAVWAFPRGQSNLLATTPFRIARLRVLRRLPGVHAVRLFRGSFLDFGDRRVWVTAQPPGQPNLVPPHQLLSGSLPLADARLRAGGWAVMSRGIAQELGLGVGDSFLLPAPVPILLRVAALSTNIGWPSGAIVLGAADYIRAWASPDPSAYEISLSSVANPATVARAVSAALGPTSGLTVQTAADRDLMERAASRQGLARLSQIATLVLIAAILAITAAMGSMIWQRRTRLARLKLDGRTSMQVWRALLLESVLLLGSGCSIGAAFGLYGQVLGSRALLAVTSFPVVFSVAVLVAVSSFVLVVLVAIAVTALPGYLVARVSPALGLSD
ncbi:MAG TPA: FtsX-like permease family protein [Solirubrobacteraceae bacterium]|nr:FtsX-like permease family protein [Solirubrobacteraceae bacterium]